MNGKIDIAAVRASVELAEVIARYVELKRSGREWVALCPFHNEKTASFFVVPEKGFFHCFGCGAGGDVINFVQRIEGCDFMVAVRILTGNDAGRVTLEQIEAVKKRNNERTRHEQANSARRRAAAQDIWTAARSDIAGTLAEAYLFSRGLRRPRHGWPPTLRFAPALTWRHGAHNMDGSCWPALIGLVSVSIGPPAIAGVPAQESRGARSRRFVGVHRTYLARDGSGKAPLIVDGKLAVKRMLGTQGGGAIWFGPATSRLHVGEGIETTLSAKQIRPKRTYAAAGSLDRMARLVLPDVVREIVLLMDNDMKDPSTGPKAIERARLHYGAQGVKVLACWAPPDMDFNDPLRKVSVGT